MSRMANFITKFPDTDERGAYKTVMELPRNGRIIKAVIRAADDSGSAYLWQVASRFSDVYFRTLTEAKAYCKEHGWLQAKN